MDIPRLAVLFDMDGVLIDSMPVHLESRQRVAQQYGFTPAELSEASLQAGSLKEWYALLQALRPFSQSFADFSNAMLKDLFKLMELKHFQPDPELLAFLRQIRSNGMEVAIGTSAVRRSALHKLAKVELHNEFDIIVTADDVDKHKPFPDVYLKAAELLEVEPHHCVVIDDQAKGIQAGKSAGAKTIGFTKYLQDASSLAAAQPDLLANSFAQLSPAQLRHLINP
jgi:HAD superfamily hydrolase (TIGR01509 family)